jgi:hypothetical protein
MREGTTEDDRVMIAGVATVVNIVAAVFDLIYLLPPGSPGEWQGCRKLLGRRVSLDHSLVPARIDYYYQRFLGGAIPTQRKARRGKRTVTDE